MGAPPTYARKVDTHHAEIVQGIEDCGYPTFDCSAFGRGFPDVMVGSKAGTFILFEIKSDKEIHRQKHELTLAESNFHRLYQDYPLYIIQTLDEALEILELHHGDVVYRA